ncbi:hypothetical protein Pse7367_0969 [Thalassoporum mexicanum PCC 7367]|nr:hypothetical protein Pse7367_0969 [Pseudanabaena sp. PCC 7367]
MLDLALDLAPNIALDIAPSYCLSDLNMSEHEYHEYVVG